jgi:hypothetical protein
MSNHQMSLQDAMLSNVPKRYRLSTAQSFEFENFEYWNLFTPEGLGLPGFGISIAKHPPMIKVNTKEQF